MYANERDRDGTRELICKSRDRTYVRSNIDRFRKRSVSKATEEQCGIIGVDKSGSTRDYSRDRERGC